ncbi:gamma-glutamyl peptidase 5-like [Diospyros lotus]|uniref:gamma-glutamyl peptidase 5-like n=1 Tax=Diospyros lotus TaxID=55363 RepID=UPI002255861C|nr:gamma-glutamyl peptidase 5-like [Diospyros lotus]
MGSGKRFAVLRCAEDSDYVKKRYGGYFGVFVGMLAEEGEIWDVYAVAAGEFPADDEIAGYDGFVVTGSCSDAHGDDIWICNLLNLLKKLDTLKKRVLGVCFGHQILGRAVGGKTGRAASGWDIGVRCVHLTPAAAKLFPSLKLQQQQANKMVLSVIECHQDEVWELPPKAEVIGWSNKTRIEMFRCGDHLMGIQGHPEYNPDILLHLIHRLLHRNLISEACAEEARANLEAWEPNGEETLKKLCISFLKGRL